ncbi:ABC transporter ATP-binding protein [Alicyclobacillus cycloheptanicus]|uniref:ABC-type lipoprotein export system ATPase subunit n=1 Tax=Alicyclobacillus cycloheptanicus TaxID=1457 RepID=A0ABT9XI94_9BACL|nr:ABC transporter ATP-binding protein [Alicyclobacillus cycloheptanicus]MDQ0190032.1 ABC-type lipoprotein export system ATPase subunit [Alicyclobacillus cycloheptanicus]WDM00066.1 ABC transporter ATP-binding protein [Alicyclobacillus cycloheptanicus]
MAVLTAKRLTKVYRTQSAGVTAKALNGIDLEVAEGEFVGIMGPSGSGKTTLLNLLAGLDQLTSGELRIHDHDVSSMKPNDVSLFRRRNLGFVFQDFNLLDTLTIEENVSLPLIMDGHKGTQVLQKVRELLAYLGLEHVMHRYPYEVSGGQQQRTAVARAIVHNPKLVLADEPTGNLDSGSATALLEQFQRLNQDKKVTILMVTHDPFAASYCGRIVFIKDGQVFSKMDRTASRQTFFHEILDTLAVLEGAKG